MALSDRTASVLRAIRAGSADVSPGRRRHAHLSRIVQNSVCSLVGAVVCGGFILWRDLGGISVLIWQADDRVLALALLFFALSSGFLMLGIAVGVSFPADTDKKTLGFHEWRWW